MCVRKCQKCNWVTHKKSGFQVYTDGSDIGCDRDVEEGRFIYMFIVAAGYTLNKRNFFVHFCYASPHYFCSRCALFYANYYYFSPNYKTKANSLRLVVRTHVRDFFIHHNEERFCACFKHPPLTCLSPLYRGLPPLPSPPLQLPTSHDPCYIPI